MDIPKTIKEEVNKIAQGSDVILFGSRARDDFKKNSDWDFLILLKQSKSIRLEKEKIQERLYEIELDTGEVISSIVHLKSEWENRSVMPIYQTVKKEGIRI